jgi:hypothetical protein
MYVSVIDNTNSFYSLVKSFSYIREAKPHSIRSLRKGKGHKGRHQCLCKLKEKHVRQVQVLSEPAHPNPPRLRVIIGPWGVGCWFCKSSPLAFVYIREKWISLDHISSFAKRKFIIHANGPWRAILTSPKKSHKAVVI